jgi:hypothetical protein
VVEAKQHRARQRPAEASHHDPMQVAAGQGADLDPQQTIGQVALELERSRTRFDPDREQQLEALVLKPPGGEPQHGCRRRVQPLHVLDRHQHRGANREQAQRRQQGQTDNTLVGICHIALDERERGPDGRSLGRRQPRQQLLDHRREQVPQRGERERRLARGRLAPQHPVVPFTPQLDPCPPQRRLADSGDAFQQQRQLTAPRVEEAADALELGLALDDLSRGQRRHAISGAAGTRASDLTSASTSPPIIRRLASQPHHLTDELLTVSSCLKRSGPRLT